MSSEGPSPLTEQVGELAKIGVKNWLNLVAYLINFGITYGSLTGAFGKTNEELSAKYQTLITPAGYAFAIWGPIFIWEGAFAIAQLFPAWRTASTVGIITPWWVSACVFQVAWTIFFAQEVIPGALICMIGILVSLLGGILTADFSGSVPVAEYWLLRAPFSLHAGWIIAATALNICVLADYVKASPEVLVALSMVCFAFIAIAVALFALGTPKADIMIPVVACWALLGIYAELGEPVKLQDPSRFNFFAWPQFVISSVRLAALILGLASVLGAITAALRGLLLYRRQRKTEALATPTMEDI